MVYRLLSILICSFIIFPSTLNGQSSNQEWRADLEKMLHEFLSCKEAIDDKSPCNRFLGMALKRVYGVNDFERTDQPGQYLRANEITKYVSSSDKWTLLGSASDQNALTEANGYANLKKPVIAVLAANPHGHVVLILPGTLTPSGGWGLNVPNSASFFLNNPQKSYIGKKLSYAFQAGVKSQVKIYGRNF